MSSIAGSEQTVTQEYATHSIFRPFPLPQTGRQWFYLLFLQGFGAGIIDFGANFAIAYGMYGHQEDVRMWVFSKNTVAGDLGVTPIIQTAVSMLISSTLVHTDLHHHAIQPLPFVYPHVEHLPDPRQLFDRIFKRKHKTVEDEVLEKQRNMHNSKWTKRGFRYYYWMLVRFMFEGTEMNMIVARCGPRAWPLRILWTAAQGALLGILFGFPLWCLAIVILGPIYGTGNMGGRWAPQAIKGVYGCIVGWVTNPVIAALALGSQAEQHIVVVPVDAEAGIPGDNIHTIAEEGEEGEDGVLTEPSPFLRPTSVHLPPSPQTAGRPRADTGLSQRSRSGSVVLQGTRLTPTRSRSNSSATILRPPLTTNISNISYLGGGSVVPIPSAPTPRTPGSSTAGRPRGTTVSSVISGFAATPQGSVSVSSSQQYQYVLGGHGGRARRSRSNTTATIPDAAILSMGRSPQGSTVPKGSLSPERPPIPPFMRPRTNSDLAGGAGHAEDMGRSASMPGQEHPPAAQDVFGRTSSTIPMLRVQRPSMEVSSSHSRSASGTNSSPRRDDDDMEGPLGEKLE